MKNLKFILIAVLSLVLLTATSCKKEKAPEPAPVQTAQVPTSEIEFFVDADTYRFFESYEYPLPNGSYQFIDTVNQFHSLGLNDTCVTTGKKISIQYSATSSTNVTILFIKNQSAVVKESFQITSTGNITSVMFTQFNGSPPYSGSIITCKKAIVFH